MKIPRTAARVATATAAVVALAVAGGGPAAAAGHGGPTSVSHGGTLTVFFPDDICGPRASLVTFEYRVQALHATEHDGTFNVHYTEVGTYHVDFVDPALADQESRYVDVKHHVFTPGNVEAFNENEHDFPTGLKIWFHDHETWRDDVLITDREVQRVVGCP